MNDTLSITIPVIKQGTLAILTFYQAIIKTELDGFVIGGRVIGISLRPLPYRDLIIYWGEYAR